MEHWKYPDKGRQQQLQQQQQQQLQHQAQNNSQKGKPKVATPEHSTIIQQTNPIQSIANVLNHHHSKLIQHQKKSQQFEEQAVVSGSKNKLDQQPAPSRGFANGGSTNVTSQESNSTSAFSHSSNQIDQGNSYLYAYNDFVTSTTRAQGNDVKLACRHRGLNSFQEKELVDSGGGDGGGIENHIKGNCEHQVTALHKSTLNFENNQESLIDSEEDDALSYILHQHRAQRDARHLVAIVGNDTNQQSFHTNSNRPNQYLQYEQGSSNFEAQRIDHHLSCSRSSHPRHICGIGGSHNDNLNNIAARLREESQRAFALNQRSRQIYPDNSYHHHQDQFTSNDIATIQSHQFTHDLTIIQDQLANSSTSVNNQQYNNNHDNQDNLSAPHTTSYFNLNNELHLATVPADRKALLLDNNNNKASDTGRIIDGHSQSIPLNQRTLNYHPRRNSSFLSWLFCCFFNLLSRPSPPTSTTSTTTTTNQLQHSQANLVQNTTTNVKKRRHKKTLTANESTAAVGMYTTSQQMGGVGQLGGQAGAYYTTQTPQTDTLHQAYTNHAHHAHHYPLSSDSSMCSSVFASSALRMNAFFRSCCSKKCLFVSCLMLILLIFILVISLSAYLNFLINTNKTNLTPLSGRLKVDSQGDSFTDQLSNRTSKEFLAKQQQYETILRGAFDRTQNLLKSYPNHLVKCEVYSFKQGSLWVYFRLFINRRTLMQDTQLMKRRSPDEHLDKQFLPRITQQTLHSGFEQLMINFNRDSGTGANGSERRSRFSQFGSTAELRQSRTVPDQRPSSQRDHVKSFDDQISRLMPIIESIDLQSIIVTPEFDMLQSGASLANQQQSMSDNLRASQFLTTTSTSAVMVATGTNGDKNIGDSDIGSSSTTTTEKSSSTSGPSSGPPSRPTTLQPSTETDISHTAGSSDEINVSTKKFFLYGYKENSTRPTTSSKPTVLQNRVPDQQNQDSIFLVNHHPRKPAQTTSPSSRANGLNIIASPSQSSDGNSTRQSNTLKEIISTRPTETVDSSSSRGNIVKLATTGSDRPPLNGGNDIQRVSNMSSKNSDDRLAASRNRISDLNLDQTPGSRNNISFNVTEITILDSNKSQTRKDKGVNETVLTQMVAPYQKIEFSPLQPQQDLVSNSTLPQAKDTSIQDLWNNALGNNKKNITSKIDRLHGTEQSSQPKRLVTVTTIGSDHLGSTNSSGLDWSKISSEISNTIRASMNASMQTTTFPTSTLSWPSSTTQKPKVSPHLKQGGSLISTPTRQNHDTHSAIVLRDFSTISNEGQIVGAASNNSAQHHVSSTRPTPQNRQDKTPRKPSQSGSQRNVPNSNSNSTNTNDSNWQRAPKATIKPHKFKKVSIESTQFVARNDSLPLVTTASSAATTTSANTPSVTTTSNGTLINSKGIRIVDHFLASINPGRELLSQNMNSTVATNLRQNNKTNKTQEAFNYDADLIMPTLPATIELTRSTTSLPPTRTTSFHPLQSDGGWSVGFKTTPGSVDHSTTTSSSQMNQRYSTSPASISTESSNKFGAVVTNSTQSKPKNVYMAPTTAHLSNSAATFGGGNQHHSKQQSSTPTSSFSSQWKPINMNPNNSTVINIDESWIKNRTSTRREPNISLIVNNDRLTPIVNVPSNQGSQSPFAMSTSILENQLKPNGNSFSQQVARRPNKILGNSFQLVAGPSNDFESHRMSRMRLGDTTPSLELFSQTEAQASSSSTTPGPSVVESNTRVVDDFMITTGKVDADTRSSTLLPPRPLLQLGSHLSVEPSDRLRAVGQLDLQPRRTRGPFAFETLKSVATSAPSPSSLIARSADHSSDHLSEINLQQRSERSPFGQGANQKLLVRKKLFLGNGDDDEFKAQTSTENPNLVVKIVDVNKIPSAGQVIPATESNPSQNLNGFTGEKKEVDQFGNRNRPVNPTIRYHQPLSVNQGLVSTSHSSNYNTFKCQYYGCNAKNSMKFVCLNYTQICDDFLDCQDESDELDCVSLLKHDSKSNRLSFSNGGGIIYLNRKGSLAPMCIDYFTESDNRLSSLTNAAHDMDTFQLEMIKKQQELIRQINTIGQYACSLQSFSRLVSVKVNHHDLVDSLNLIKTSKLYHRLSIIGSPDNQSSNAQFGSYKSATSEHEVEVSTSTSCPSQRTVFVKCGSFECGQDSFSVIDRSNSTNKKDGVIINDFPWLVKLYWWGSLSCHGYLIDELWLISSSECFVNKSRTTTATDDGTNGWSAEISYEHYGNDDYQTIESNRRIIKDIIMQPSDSSKQSLGPSIVLAKFEKPIRFSPLNRPICLPMAAMNKTTFESDRMYKDCVTATLPLSGSVSPTQDLLLNRVKVHKSTDCLAGESSARLRDDLICAAEMTINDGGGSGSLQVKEDEATRVLICSSSQANRSRSKWTVVGIQNKAQGLHLNDNKQLFTTVSSQIDWIVDTMNPKSYTNLGLDGNSSSGNELNPLSTSVSQNQTCNRFKCSSGECLSWSRICDGLYDCSSHEDEKDCHK